MPQDEEGEIISKEMYVMKKFYVFVSAVLVTVGMAFTSASAVEWEKYDKPVLTKVVVRVLSHGAKAMSPHTGGDIVIKDAETGAVLAKGSLDGSTGDDTALMRTGYPRMSGKAGLVRGDAGMLRQGNTAVPYESTSDAAGFEATIPLTKPTRIIVEAYGPTNPEHSKASATVSALVFPGEDVTGTGIVMELRGLIVDVPNAMRDSDVKAGEVAGGISVPFGMRMMCGCPIAPAGMGLSWQAENYNITVQAYYKGALYYEDIKTSDKLIVNVSQFNTKVPLPKDLPEGGFRKERIKVRIMAAQPDQANYGMDEFNLYLGR